MPQIAKLCRWVCLECHYIYDPAKGDPRGRPRKIKTADTKPADGQKRKRGRPKKIKTSGFL